jgi:hypothetical protein
MHLGERLAAFGLAHGLPLAIARPALLGHRHGLVELGDRAEHLPNQLCCRCIVLGERRPFRE